MLRGKSLYRGTGLGLFWFLVTGTSLAPAPLFYQPLTLPCNTLVEDRLSRADMPTGEGGFARDYGVSLGAGEHIALDLQSQEFDPVVMLINPDGATLGANDDAPLGGPDSLLLARIPTSGVYTVRVRAFGSPAVGSFTLKVSCLH